MRLGDFKVLLALFSSVIFTAVLGYRISKMGLSDDIVSSLSIPPR